MLCQCSVIRWGYAAGQGAWRIYPQPYLEFIRLFNEERFWDAHEVLEGPWRRNRSPFYRGIIIYASAFVHVQRGNPVGVWKQMGKVLNCLPPYGPGYMGLDVEAILACARLCRDRVSGRDDLRGDVDGLRAVIPFPQLALDPQHLRGDEPELFGEGG